MRSEEANVPAANLRAEALRAWLRQRQAILITFVASRLIVVFTTYVAFWHRRPAGWSPWLSPPLRGLGAWDAEHYAHIAIFGYVEPSIDPERFRFFPLWPLLVRIAADLLPWLEEVSAGPILAHVLTLAAVLWLRSLLLRETGSEEIAQRTCIYLLLFPAAYVLSMAYSEALFLLLTVGFFDLLRRRRWQWAAGMGLLAGLTRPQGLVLSIAALVEVVRYTREQRASIREGHVSLSSLFAAAMNVVAPGIGVALYLGYAHVVAGNALLPFSSQWAPDLKGRPTFFLWEPIRKFGEIFTDGVWPNVLLGLIAIVAISLSVYALRRLPSAYAAYSLVSVVLATSATNFGSVDRYVLVLFPLFWALGIVGKRVWVDAGYRALSPVLMGAIAVLAWLRTWVP